MGFSEARMDFLKEFGKQFSGKNRSASEKSKEGAELARLNGELRSAEAALEALYGRFGQACYVRRLGRGSDETVESLALRIRAELLRIEELTAARDAARTLKRCPGCGALFPREARFCSACGKKLPEEPPRPEPVEPGAYCENCGARREGDEVRCPVCGFDFDARHAPKPSPAPEAACAGPDVEEPEESME